MCCCAGQCRNVLPITPADADLHGCLCPSMPACCLHMPLPSQRRTVTQPGAACRCLAAALADLQKQGLMNEHQVQLRVINPKSITMGQLYGQVRGRSMHPDRAMPLSSPPCKGPVLTPHAPRRALLRHATTCHARPAV
jgi:hypothetical protein